MFQVRIHGRGGQGVVTAAELLSVAAFLDGREAQAFPTFGSERTGAPVVAFCRMDDKPIRVREPISEPDAVIVQDPTRADRYLGHAGTTVSDRYRHRLRGQLESDGALLDAYVWGEGATVIALPLTGAPARASELESVTFATTRAEGIR